MSNVSQWSTTAANNNAASPNGNPEGMSPSGVNDSAREEMAALAKWYGDTDGTLVTTGSANTYLLTTNNVHAALADQSIIAVRINVANTGASTLNVDSLGAKALKIAGKALVSGQLVINQIIVVNYNATNDEYDIIGGDDFQYLPAAVTVAGTDKVVIRDTSDSDNLKTATAQSIADLGPATADFTFISAASASSDATIEFTGIDSTYDEYELHLLNVIPASDGFQFYMRTSSDGGSTFDTTGAYAWNQIVLTGTAVSDAQSASSDEIQITNQTVGSDANELGVSGVIKLIRPSESTYTYTMWDVMHNQGATVPFRASGAGWRASAGVVDAVQFLFSSGNVESGLFALYGIKRT